jgi:dihydropyrimidine dehydrogenase (NADP+)
MKDLGVQVQYGKKLGTDGLSIEELKKQGYESVFVGIGLPEPKVDKIFDGLTTNEGFYTSKSFLPLVSKASKPGMCACKSSLPELFGRVVVLGAGDTAMDCATAAFRCGAQKVYIIFRRGSTGVRAVPKKLILQRMKNVNLFLSVSQNQSSREMEELPPLNCTRLITMIKIMLLLMKINLSDLNVIL